ncbi:hypothetical protein L7F22_016686 [Adiantum nelumboides]|nr:hypothetical protein [Adiantum nelumboides]
MPSAKTSILLGLANSIALQRYVQALASFVVAVDRCWNVAAILKRALPEMHVLALKAAWYCWRCSMAGRAQVTCIPRSAGPWARVNMGMIWLCSLWVKRSTCFCSSISPPSAIVGAVFLQHAMN